MLFFEQIAEGDKEFLALEAANIDVDRAILAYETAVADRELRLRKADVKCFVENGDVLDLMQYYAEAANEEKEQGLLQKAWDAIKNLFTRIRNVLFGCKNKELPPNVSLPEKIGKFLQDLPGQWQAVKGSITWKNLVAGAGAIATFVGFMEGGTKWLEAKAVEGKEKMEESTSADAGPVKKFASTVITKALDIIIEALDVLNKLVPEKKSENGGENNNGNGENNEGEEKKEKSGIPNPLTKLKEYFNRFSTWVRGIYNSLTGKKDDENTDEKEENPDDGKKDGKEDGKDGEGKPDGNGSGTKAETVKDEPEEQKKGPMEIKVGSRENKRDVNEIIANVHNICRKLGVNDEEAIEKAVKVIQKNPGNHMAIAKAIDNIGAKIKIVYESAELLKFEDGSILYLEYPEEEELGEDSFVESAEDPDSIWNNYGLDSVFGSLI